MRTLVFFALVFGTFISNAQLIDKGSWYVSLVNSNAAGSYKTYLTDYGKSTSKVGFVAGYLRNPQVKSNINSPIQIGGEFGFMPWGADRVDSYTNGSFENKHQTIWLNFVGRYRPVLGASKINPFFDLFAGPEFLQTKVLEYISEAESRKLYGKTVVTKNYGAGLGAGYKFVKKNGELRYIDLGVYYQYAEKAKIARRNSFRIINGGYLDFDESLVKPTTMQIRLSLTGFL